MYPKLAAKWGSLIYFSSSFFDFTIQKIGIAESTKLLVCMFFPTLSIARASKNLVIFEYTPGGPGLNYNETLLVPYHNFRIINYFFIMVYALIVHFMIGMLFEKYGSVPEILKELKTLITGTRDDLYASIEIEKTKSRTRKELDAANFEKFDKSPDSQYR